MLSYRHAFHAGNHADVLKHLVLVELLDYLAQKDKPFWYIDTHAGAGVYGLDSPAALKNAEFENGIGRLWPAGTARSPWPGAIEHYLAAVRAGNPGTRLLRYPGSPQIALQSMRKQDRAHLFDLHSTDRKLLTSLGEHDRRARVVPGDGFAGLKALLPPPPRRALVLIDPSYEDKQDYRTVVAAVEDALERFASGLYLIWYPLLARREAVQLPPALARLRERDWLQVELQVKAESPDGIGMHGSGLFVFNPPWTLPDTLRTVMPVLVERLGQDATARFTLQHRIA